MHFKIYYETPTGSLIIFCIPYFSIDNAHPTIFVAPFDIKITRIRLLAVGLGSTDRGWMNSLIARVLLVVIVVILSLMKKFLDLTSSMFNKYYVILLSYI
jgi:hypothetical protein